MKTYKIEVDMIEHGYIEVKASSIEEARKLVVDMDNRDGFVGVESESIITGDDYNK